MIRVFKNGLVVVAAGAIVALAPSVASANQWTENGVQFNGPAHVAGTLSTTIGSGATSTCDITATVQLANAGAPPLGIASGTVVTIAATSCTINVPGCTVSTVFSGLPWTVTTSGVSITTSGIQYVSGYSGATCALNGVAVATSGTVAGDTLAGTNVVQYDAAAGLTTALGAILLNGELEVFAEDASGDPDYSRPIELT